MNTNLFARTLKRAGALAGLCTAFWGGPALAQSGEQREEEPDTIVTDRPDFTESALAVRNRVLQIENGFTYVNDRGSTLLGGPETLIRYGVGRKWELRLGLPNYFSQREGGVTSQGWGNTYLGAKVQLGPTKNGWDFSLIPAVFIPTGSLDFRSDAIYPELKFCYATDLSDRWSLSGMFYWAQPVEDGRRSSPLQSTLSFGWDLGGRWSTFFEYVGTFAHGSEPAHLFHSGVIYLINKDTQLDIHYGFGLNNTAPESFIAAGISFRFGSK